MTMISLQTLYDEAQHWLQQGARDRVLELAQYTLRFYPDSLEAFRLLGDAHLANRHFEQARAAFAQVLRADPQHVVARIGLGHAYERDGMLERAIAEFEQVVEIKADATEVRSRLANLYLAIGGNAAPVVLSRPALAYLYLHGQMLPMAIREFRALVATHPERLDFQIALAEALWRNDQKEAAVDLCRQVLLHTAEALKPNLLLGYALLAEDDEEGSLCWNKARALDPCMQLARVLLKPTPEQLGEVPMLPAPGAAAEDEQPVAGSAVETAAFEAAPEPLPDEYALSAEELAMLRQTSEADELLPASGLLTPDNGLSAEALAELQQATADAPELFTPDNGLSAEALTELQQAEDLPALFVPDNGLSAEALAELQQADDLPELVLPPSDARPSAAFEFGALPEALPNDYGLSPEELAELPEVFAEPVPETMASSAAADVELDALGLSPEELDELQMASMAAALDSVPVAEPDLSLSDFGLSEEELAELQQAAEQPAFEASLPDSAPELALPDFGLSEEELAELQQVAEQPAFEASLPDSAPELALPDFGLSEEELAELQQAAEQPAFEAPLLEAEAELPQPTLEPNADAMDELQHTSEIAALDAVLSDQPLDDFDLGAVPMDDFGLSAQELAMLHQPSEPSPFFEAANDIVADDALLAAAPGASSQLDWLPPNLSHDDDLLVDPAQVGEEPIDSVEADFMTLFSEPGGRGTPTSIFEKLLRRRNQLRAGLLTEPLPTGYSNGHQPAEPSFSANGDDQGSALPPFAAEVPPFAAEVPPTQLPELPPFAAELPPTQLPELPPFAAELPPTQREDSFSALPEARTVPSPPPFDQIPEALSLGDLGLSDDEIAALQSDDPTLADALTNPRAADIASLQSLSSTSPEEWNDLMRTGTPNPLAELPDPLAELPDPLAELPDPLAALGEAAPTLDMGVPIDTVEARLLELGRQQGYIDISQLIAIVDDPQADAEYIDALGQRLYEAGVEIRHGDTVLDITRAAEPQPTTLDAQPVVERGTAATFDTDGFDPAQFGLSDEELALLQSQPDPLAGDEVAGGEDWELPAALEPDAVPPWVLFEGPENLPADEPLSEPSDADVDLNAPLAELPRGELDLDEPSSVLDGLLVDDEPFELADDSFAPVAPPRSDAAARLGTPGSLPSEEQQGVVIIADYLEQLDADPDNNVLRLAVARLSAKIGRHDLALDQYKQLVKQDAFSDELAEDLRDLMAEVSSREQLFRLHRLLGDVYSSQGRYREAINEYSWMGAGVGVSGAS